MLQLPCVIINADDFGYSLEVNKAISESFDREIISSTSLMVNMDGFTDAVEIIGTNLPLRNNVGLHINLVEGVPLSDCIKKQKRFCDADGRFSYRRNRAIFSLSTDEKKALQIEVKSQIERALNNGIKISHVDSHHATHIEWGISQVVLNLLEDFQIKKVRIARNMGVKRSGLRELYKHSFNYFLRFKNFKGVDLFGDVDDFYYCLKTRTLQNKIVELMVHPIAASNGTIKDLDYENIKEKLTPVLEKYRIVGYSEL
jgi:chitin disaccharide deacetylase